MRYVFAFLWFLALYIVSSVFIGVTFSEPATTREGAILAGEAAAAKFGNVNLWGSVLVAWLGTYLEILPGTKKRSSNQR